MPCVVLTLLVIVAGSAPAADLPKVGQTVMPTQADVRLESPNSSGGQVKVSARAALYVVREVKDGELHLQASGHSGWGKGGDWLRLEDAASHYTEILRVSPKDCWALTYRGIAWKERGELDSARRDFDVVTRLEPKNPSAHLNVANVWSLKGDYDRAIESLDKALQLNPDYADAHFNRGTAWMAKKDYDQAINDFAWVIRLQPTAAWGYNQRANAWIQKGRLDKAIEDYTEAFRHDPAHPGAVYNRSRLWANKGEYRKALADLDEALRLDPNFRNALSGKARLLSTCPDDSIRDGKKAVELGTRACEQAEWKDGDALDALASACAEVGDFDKALAHQKKALDEPAFAEHWRDQARARIDLYGRKQPYRDKPAVWPAPPLGPKS